MGTYVSIKGLCMLHVSASEMSILIKDVINRAPANTRLHIIHVSFHIRKGNSIVNFDTSDSVVCRSSHAGYLAARLELELGPGVAGAVCIKHYQRTPLLYKDSS